ncbi:Glycogenin putative isoform 1 [Tripterygium wilfordii]|uniref:Glycogenin putative isoform 1 n=1 Tax=Tripterygium wilfordii TaxID=458696 RepID=A0A7J7DL49_TRIWF|nr:Glycogenin putative isoform 1 [Tripterygium wilfordii]
MMRKAIPKALFVKISLFFLAVFLVIYAALLLRPSSSTYFENAATVVTCSLRECNHKLEKGFKMKAVLEETQVVPSIRPTSNVIKLEVPSFMDKRGKRMKIGMVNMEEEDASEWRTHGEVECTVN